MKKLKLTKIIASSLIVVSAFALNPIGASAEWKQDSNGWWNTEGSSWSVGWRKIDGKYYYFGQDGYMVHDTTIDGYNIGSDGAWVQSIQNSSLTSEEDKKATTSDNNNFTIAQFVSIMKTKVDNLEVEDADADEDFIHTTRKIIKTDDEQLDVYIYNCNEEMEKDSLNIDSEGSGYTYTLDNGKSSSTNISWISDPHFYKKGNIIVQYVGQNEKIISYLNDIFGEQFAGYKESSN